MDFLHRTWAEIDLTALIHNFKEIKANCQGSKIMAVVKANAYGHSVGDIAPALDKAGADWFAVSNIDEAIQLRELGIKKDILILGYTPAELACVLAENNITQAVFSSVYAKSLSDEATRKNVTVKIHIKLDTGMGRIGFDCRDNSLCEIDEAIASAKLQNLEFNGIFTHFAFSDRVDNEDNGFTDEQYNRFTEAVKKFKANGLTPELCHCCNSAATSLDVEKRLDICRPGIILYGLTPSNNLKLKENLIPVMTLKSVVSMVKEIRKGDTVNYGRTFKAQKNMRIATVAAGYADGYPRLLSNKGYVLVNGKKAPIVGRVCMDQLCVDVSDVLDAKMGDEVILFGKELPVEELAKICETINYEIVCGISPRVPRVIL
ncbi:MAG: alanine racemase [Clostridia bacterium]|nr:alanine racemase [Clostridia bacterium]